MPGRCVRRAGRRPGHRFRPGSMVGRFAACSSRPPGGWSHWDRERSIARRSSVAWRGGLRGVGRRRRPALPLSVLPPGFQFLVLLLLLFVLLRRLLLPAVLHRFLPWAAIALARYRGRTAA